MSPSRPFILRPVATALLMVALLLAGGVAFFQLPISALPEVDYPTIQVQTFYPGASPTVVASAVTAPLERQFGQVAGLTQMTSSSTGGLSVIVLQFQLSLDIDVAEQEVQAAINAAQTYLPAGLPAPPIYSKSNPADAPVLTLALTSKEIPLATVEDLADTRLAPKISQISGVGLVTLSGGQKPAVRIQANPAALASYGLNLEDVRTALTANSLNAALGNFDGPAQDYTINANDQLLTSAAYQGVVVAYRDGAPVMLRDVAHITDGIENESLAAWYHDQPAIILSIQRQPGANTIQVVDRIERLLPTLETNLPRALHIEIVTDRTTAIRASIRDVEFELTLAIVLVVAVIFLFLRSLPATVIPSVSVPLALVGTFGVMYLLGYSLNNLAMMALTIATGFLVDDAIVMIENISRYVEEGLPPREAALRGAEQIGFTIISLTVSLIAVLIPLLFMGDIAGRLFRQFAVTLAVTILLSAIISLTLTPMLCARLLRRHRVEERSWFDRTSERLLSGLINAYGRTLSVAIRHRLATLLVAIATLALTAWLYATIPKGFFPVQDTGIVQGISVADPTISGQAMAERQQALGHVLERDPAVTGVSSFIGPDGINTTLNSGRFEINLAPLAQRHLGVEQVIARLLHEAGSVEGLDLYLQPVQDLTVDDRVSRAQFQFSLENPDAATLARSARLLEARLRSLPLITHVTSDQVPGGIAVVLDYDRVTASRLGLTPQALDNTLYDAFGQRQVNTLYTQLNQYHVILEADPRFQRSPAALSRIYVQGGTGVTSAAASTGTGATGAGAGPTGSAAAAGTSLLQPHATTGTGTAAVATSALSPTSSVEAAAAAIPTVIDATASSAAAGTPAGDTGSPTLAIGGNGGGSGGRTGSGGSGSAASGAAGTASLASPVPLSAVVHVHRGSEDLAILHQGQFPAATLSFDLAPGASLGEAVRAVDEIVSDLHLPASTITAWQGSAAAFRNSLTNEGLLLLAAMVTVYIVLGVLYESFIHPVTILSTLPSAGVGALLALRLQGMDLDIVAIIGIILLIGIVQKNGIMMVDFALDLQRRRGLAAEEAIHQACLLRFRPILMTTLAAILSGLPLALGSGIGAELRRPLGVAIVGGLLLSQILTLYTTPIIYILFDRLAPTRPLAGEATPPGGDAGPEPTATGYPPTPTPSP